MVTKTEGRKKNFAKNTIFAILAQIVITIVGFFSRKIFLQQLGVELLGVNSLFGDILTIFSFADLGVGNAIMFALYKPIAEDNQEEIVTLLKYYKKIYFIVIAVIVAIGLAFLPFLGYLQSDVPINDLRLYYALFVLNNIIGYVWAYRESYVIAKQRERILTIINMLYTLILYVTQIMFVMAFKNYLIYLIIGVASLVIKKVITNFYITCKYPETKFKKAKDITKDQKNIILKKSGSLVIHRVSNLAINQTDSLVVSSIISVAQWGIVSNYILIKHAITSITDKVYSSLLPSMGNLISEGNIKKRNDVFKIYDFANFWLFSFCSIALAVLSTPFIALFLGAEVTLSEDVIFVFCTAFLLDGLRAPVSLMREASGQFEQDKWFSIIAAVANVGISIGLGIVMGITGVFIGTICAMLILNISRSIILFKNNNDYEFTPLKYLLHILKYILIAIGCFIITYFVCEIISKYLAIGVLRFFLMSLVVLFVPNSLIVLLFLNNSSFRYVISFVFRKIKTGDKKND